MKFESGIRVNSTLKKEVINHPNFGSNVEEAIKQTLNDKSEHILGRAINLMVILPIHPLVEDAEDYDKYEPVSIFMVTDFQEFRVLKDGE